MKQEDIKVGSLYLARVSRSIVKVRIDRPATEAYWSKRKQWYATNTATGRTITVTAARLRKSVTPATEKLEKRDSDQYWRWYVIAEPTIGGEWKATRAEAITEYRAWKASKDAK